MCPICASNQRESRPLVELCQVHRSNYDACLICGGAKTKIAKTCMFCQTASNGARKFDGDPATIARRHFLDSISYIDLGLEYGLSATNMRKWCFKGLRGMNIRAEAMIEGHFITLPKNTIAHEIRAYDLLIRERIIAAHVHPSPVSGPGPGQVHEAYPPATLF